MRGSEFGELFRTLSLSLSLSELQRAVEDIQRAWESKRETILNFWYLTFNSYALSSVNSINGCLGTNPDRFD